MQPAAEAAARLSEQSQAVASSLSGVPLGVGAELSEGLGTAADETATLAEQTSTLGDTIGTSATAASALIARQDQLARSQVQASQATAQETQQLRLQNAEAERSIRIGSRRAAAVGPFRLAGVGLGVGAAVFTATRALSDLSEDLRVTGDEAGTTEGRLRNMGAAVLSGDVLGAFKALNNETRSYTISQLVAISQTEQLEAALRGMGQGANIAKSQLAGLTQIAEVPQFLQTALAQAQFEGDEGQELAVLERMAADVLRRIQVARQIGRDTTALNIALEAIYQQGATIQRQRDAQGSRQRSSRASADRFAGEATRQFLGSLEKERAELERRLQGARSDATAKEGLNRELLSVRQEMKDRERAVTEDLFGADAPPGLLAAGDQNAVADRLSTDAYMASLKREEAELLRRLNAATTSASERKGIAAKLEAVNENIESTHDAIVAEEKRHREAMLDKILDIGVLEDLESQAGGGSSTAGRSRRAAAIRATLERGTIDGKRLTREQKERLNGELVSINREIEAEQDATIAEAERHADEVQRQADELQRKLAEADQAFLRGLGIREGRLRNRELRAAATASLNDDIATSEAIQAALRESIRATKRTIRDARLRADTAAQLTADLEQEQRDERTLRRQQRQEAISRREESLDLDIQLAQVSENVNAELRAHRAKIRFLQERIRHTREGTNQRKRLILELRQEQAAIRDLLKEGKDQGASFEALSFDFLQQLQGFSSNIASNLLPRNTGVFAPPPTSTTGQQQQPPAAKPPISRDIASPFERGGAQGPGGRTTTTQADAAAGLREAGGTPPTSGQLTELIRVGRRTNTLLTQISTGLGHVEARQIRRAGRHGGGHVSVE